MATSIRDLLHTLESEAPHGAGTDRQARDAAGALSELGRALRRLARDGLDLDIDGRREQIARDLAESCTLNADTAQHDAAGRLTSLAGGLADAVGLLGEQAGRDQRWAITVELAAAARVLSTYATAGDARRTAELVWTHQTARALVVHAQRDTVSVPNRAMLDRAMPQAILAPGRGAASAARDALGVISDRLRRSAAGLDRRPSLLEVFAVTRAAESTSCYATAAVALAGQPTQRGWPAARIWREVRNRLQPFTGTAPRSLEDRDLGAWAQRVHGELRREFGAVDQPRVRTPEGTMKVDAVRHLQAMVNELPEIADHLATAVLRLADHGDLHSLAERLPFREQRLEQFLDHRAVVADRFDVITLMDHLDNAATLAAQLAVTLDRAGGLTVEAPQPALLAANAARAIASRPDPLAALMEQVRDGTPAAKQIDYGQASAELEPPELRSDHVDDADCAAGVECDVE